MSEVEKQLNAIRIVRMIVDEASQDTAKRIVEMIKETEFKFDDGQVGGMAIGCGIYDKINKEFNLEDE